VHPLAVRVQTWDSATRIRSELLAKRRTRGSAPLRRFDAHAPRYTALRWVTDGLARMFASDNRIAARFRNLD
jgi:hypothetical protein